MTRYIKITRKEIIELIEVKYGIADLKFMRQNGYEPDSPVCDDFEYVEGVIPE